MKRFDYSFLVKGKVPVNLLNITNAISELNGLDKSRKTLYKNVFTELEKIAKIQSVKGSNEIEGILTTDSRIREIVNGNSAPLNHNEAEIAGYRDALNIVHENNEYIGITESEILRLHAVMLSFVGADDAGRYKSEDNVIMEIDDTGKRKIRFRTVPARETPEAMQQLFLAYMDAKADSKINNLLLIPCFILDFLCIHPFRDGNGRMSRLLSLLMLYKNGYDAGKYVSYEQQVSLDKWNYYEALRRSSENWHENKNDYIPFIENFLINLLRCYKKLDKRFGVSNSRYANKSERVETIVLNSLMPLSKQEICDILPDVSPTTVEAVLSKLVKTGSIVKLGKSRNTKYIKA